MRRPVVEASLPAKRARRTREGGGDAGGEPLLAVGAQDAAELDGVGGLQQVLGGHS